MASMIVILIVLACAAYQYLKGTFVKAFAMLIIIICANTVAFAYFETVANILIARDTIVLWAHCLSFTVLFVLTVVILETAAAQLCRQKIDLGRLAEGAGRVICGLLSGLMLAGALLTCLAMAPLPDKFPYQRFEQTPPNPQSPRKSFLNADGFTTGLFGILSSGSFGGKTSFAAVHPSFLNEVFLSRQNAIQNIPVFTEKDALDVPKKNAVWPAASNLKDTGGKPVSPRNAHTLTIVRLGFERKAVKQAGKFTLSQLTLGCKQQEHAKKPLEGKAYSAYPIGYLRTANSLERKQLNDVIEIGPADFDDKVKWLDFVFDVPNGFVPVLAKFKQNNIVQLPAPVGADQAPETAAFIPSAACARDSAQVKSQPSARIYGVELACDAKFLAGSSLQISDPNQWLTAQSPDSIAPARFQDGKISYVRAQLKTGVPETKQDKTGSETPKKPKYSPRTAPKKTLKGLASFLEPRPGYKLLSLKCNKPAAGSAISAGQLPALQELSGTVHHPVGIVAGATAGDETVYEVDYCCLDTSQINGGLVIADDGSVAQPFPPGVWLTQQGRNISEFYVLYLIKTGKKSLIVSVHSTQPPMSAQFEKYEAFLVE